MLVQDRGKVAVLSAVIAVHLHHSAMDTWLDYSALVQGRGEMADLPAVISVLLYHSAMDTLPDYSVVSAR